jgi:hypothetical protein
MKPIKLPFGLNENNILVHIADVERGKKCNCVCPSCRSSLIATRGNKNQPHFKHAVVNKCEGGFESAVHLAAKQIIRQRKRITLSRCISIASAKDSKGKEHTKQKTVVEDGTIICFDSVQEETELHGMKADILAEKGNTSLIIEIFYRHKVEDQKREKIVEANISAIEINLSDLTSEDVKDWEAFWLYINDPERIEWLYNAKSRTHYLELEKQLVKTIRGQEEKYKQEEIQKQRKERRKKEQLLQALDELKTLASEESIAQFKQEAKTHPVWKHNAKYLPFSWQELPDFVSADIPNGDWIFGCDRRIWQTAFYKSFVWNSSKNRPFCVKLVDDWLQNKVGCKVHQSVKIVLMYSRRYYQLVPVNVYANRPSPWKTLRTYFNYLEKLEMLEWSGDDYHNPGNAWFRVIDKQPQAEALLKQLNSLEGEIIEWVEWMPFVFNDKENIDDQMSDSEKKAKELLDGLDSIEEEGSILIKNVSHLVKTLKDFIKETRYGLRVVCFVNSTKEAVSEAHKKLSAETLQNFRNNVSVLRKELQKNIFYENL